MKKIRLSYITVIILFMASFIILPQVSMAENELKLDIVPGVGIPYLAELGMSLSAFFKNAHAQGLELFETVSYIPRDESFIEDDRMIRIIGYGVELLFNEQDMLTLIRADVSQQPEDYRFEGRLVHEGKHLVFSGNNTFTENDIIAVFGDVDNVSIQDHLMTTYIEKKATICKDDGVTAFITYPQDGLSFVFNKEGFYLFTCFFPLTQDEKKEENILYPPKNTNIHSIK